MIVAEKTITPKLALASFTCPHCHAISHQTWYNLWLDKCGKGEPFVHEHQTGLHVNQFEDENQGKRAITYVGVVPRLDVYSIHIIDSGSAQASMTESFVLPPVGNERAS